MDQVWQGGSRLLERNVGKWFIGTYENSVIGDAGVRNFLHIAFLHVATCAVIGWLLLFTYVQRKLAACFAMTSQAFLFEVFRSFLTPRFYVRVVASDATHAFPAAAITFAQGH